MRSHGAWEGRRFDVMWFAALPLEWTMRERATMGAWERPIPTT
jgi:hypothetical protein